MTTLEGQQKLQPIECVRRCVSAHHEFDVMNLEIGLHTCGRTRTTARYCKPPRPIVSQSFLIYLPEICFDLLVQLDPHLVSLPSLNSYTLSARLPTVFILPSLQTIQHKQR